MHIFIDESGGFIPLSGSRQRVSCVAALVIPSRSYPTVAKRWRALAKRYRPDGGEVKGSSLSEPEMAEVASLLTKFDCILEAVLIDMGGLSDEDVSAFKERQVEKILGGSPDPVDPAIVEQVDTLATATAELSNQDFVQGYVTIALIDKVLRMATAYYSQRNGTELQDFVWRIDAKGEGTTPGERFWTEMVFPALTLKSKNQPLGIVAWGDYSEFSAEEIVGDDRVLINVSRIMSDLEFVDSEAEPGIQLVDVAASAVSRAMNGTLRQEGYEAFGGLLIHTNRNREVAPPLQVVTLRTSEDQPDRVVVQSPLAGPLGHLQSRAKPMVPRWHRHHIKAEG